MYSIAVRQSYFTKGSPDTSSAHLTACIVVNYNIIIFAGSTNNFIEIEEITQQPCYIGGHTPHTISHSLEAQRLHSKDFFLEKVISV